jgi:hypothetical protein
MKFMGIHETPTDMASGWSVEDHKTACLEFYKKRYGLAFDIYAVYEYPVTKTSSCPFAPKLTRNSLLGKRPIGKKKTCQLEADAKLVKAVILEVVIKKEGGGVHTNHANRGSSAGNNSAGIDSFESNGAGGMGKVLQNISNVIADVGNFSGYT